MTMRISNLAIGLAAVAVAGSLMLPPDWALAQSQQGRDRGFQTIASQALLLDEATGAVLFEKAADDLVAPASMAKLMTAAILFEEI